MINLDAAAVTALASPRDEDVEQLAAGIAAHDLQEEEPWRSLAVENFLRRHTASGALDEEFEQLLELQDDENPHFVAEVLKLFIEDGERWMVKAENWVVKNIRDDRVDAEGFSIKQAMQASASCIGAARLLKSLRILRDCKNEVNPKASRCADAFVKVKEDFRELKEVIEEYLQVDKEEIVEERQTATDAPKSDPLIEPKGDT